MDGREVRMRCIEALSGSGVREVQRTINEAKILEEWVLAAEDKEPSPKRKPRAKTADKE